MNKLLKQLLAVLLSLQTSLSGISTTALAEEEYGNPPYDTTEQINEEDEEVKCVQSGFCSAEMLAQE